MSDASSPSAGPPTPVEDQFQQLLDSLQSNIGRYVAFILTPLLLPLVGAGALWLQNQIGFDIQSIGGTPAVVGFIVSTVGGLAAVLVTWLRNRGNHEKAAVEALTLLKAGEDSARSIASGGDVAEPGPVPEGGEYPLVAPSPDRTFPDVPEPS